MNDFLYSNEVIYKAFYANQVYRGEIIEEYKNKFQKIGDKAIKANYFSENFGNKYFSMKDALIMQAYITYKDDV